MKKILTAFWFCLFCCGFTLMANAEECDHWYTSYSEWEYFDANYHIRKEVCEDCGKELSTEKEKHYWNDWEIIKEATIKQNGQKERVCMICEGTQTQSINKLAPYVKFTKKKYTVTSGKSMKLKIIYAAGDKVKKFKSSKKSVATVSKNGRIKAKRTGTTKITVVMKSGRKATCKVKVKARKKKSTKKSSSGGGTVYWTPGGSVYHKSRNCRTLKRSKTVYSGSVSESGKSRACKVCS